MKTSKNTKEGSGNPGPFKKLFEKKKTPPFDSKHGILHHESLNLFFKKIGITEDELKAINKKSLSFTRSMVTKYSKLSKEGNEDIVNVLHHIIEHKDWPNSIASYGTHAPLPNPWWAPAPFPTPSGPPLVYEQPVNFLEHGSAHAEGRDSGLLTSHDIIGGDDDQWKGAGAIFRFPGLRVPVSGFYLIDAPVLIAGQYFLVADDGPCDSKEAYCVAYSFGTIEQWYNETQLIYNSDGYQLYKSPTYLSPVDAYSADHKDNDLFNFYDGGQNINKMDTFALVSDLFVNDVRPIWLSKDSDITLEVCSDIFAAAKGEGSVADINCEVNSGGILCPCVKMWLITS